MRRSGPLRRRTHLRAVGRAGYRREARLRVLRPLLAERSGGRCEVPWCGKRRPLDPHHLEKRWRGAETDALQKLLHVCRACHDAFDLPAGHRDSLRAWVEQSGDPHFGEPIRQWFVFLRGGARLRREVLEDGRRLGPPKRGLEDGLERLSEAVEDRP